MNKLLGVTVKDSISGIEGIVTGVSSFLSGCTHVCIQRKGLSKDGEPFGSIWVNYLSLEDVKKLPKVFPNKILGKKVKDKITNYEGIVIDVTDFLHSDSRVGIQSNESFEGIPVKAHVTDLSNIIREDGVKVAKPEKSGGPAETSKLPLGYQR